MEILAPGKVMRLGDIRPGGVFGTFDRGRYIRFLRTATESQTQVTVVSLGPFCDEDYAAHAQGPTAYFWETDIEVILEENTAIAPIVETATDPTTAHMTLGTVALSKSGQICLFCRSARGQSALVDLSTGEIIRSNRAVVFYKHYTLMAPDERRNMRPVFESSKQVSNISTAA